MTTPDPPAFPSAAQGTLAVGFELAPPPPPPPVLAVPAADLHRLPALPPSAYKALFLSFFLNIVANS